MGLGQDRLLAEDQDRREATEDSAQTFINIWSQEWRQRALSLQAEGYHRYRKISAIRKRGGVELAQKLQFAIHYSKNLSTYLTYLDQNWGVWKRHSRTRGTLSKEKFYLFFFHNYFRFT